MHLDDYSCALCSYQGDETIEHLFLTCLFVQACWNSIGLQANPDSAIFFMGILIIMSWTIWNSKNNLIFKNKSLSIQGAKSFFKKGFAMVIHREKPRYLPAIIHCWLDALLLLSFQFFVQTLVNLFSLYVPFNVPSFNQRYYLFSFQQ